MDWPNARKCFFILNLIILAITPLLLLSTLQSLLSVLDWFCAKGKGKGKAVPLQAWSGPDGSRKLRFPDYMATVQDGF